MRIAAKACWVSVVFLFFAADGRAGFKAAQLRSPRVRAAYANKEAEVKRMFAAAKIAYPPKALFLRAFKREKVLELWASGGGKFARVKDYAVCASSGRLGPKRREGDWQVPEGFYTVSEWNPVSQFHLSLRVNYPNASDRILGKKGAPGSDIFVHGACVTVGCLPLTDPYIEELYVIATDVRDAGGKLDIHIFPTALDETGMLYLRKIFSSNEALLKFWENLRPGYLYFERERTLPPIKVAADGKYEW